MKQIAYLFFLLFISCHQEQKQIEIRNITTLPAETKVVPEFQLKGDTIPYDALFPTDILAIDTFMLVAQHKDQHLIHVYNLKDTTYLGKFLEKGGGPTDVNMWNGFTQYWKENDEIKLLIQSNPQYIAILNLNQSLKQKKAVFEERFSFNKDSAQAVMIRSNVAYKIGADFFMARGPERCVGLKDFNPSFQWFDYQKDEPKSIVYAMDQKQYPYPILYTPGGINLNSTQDKICYACSFINLFFILDLKTNASTQIIPNNAPTDIETLISEQKSAVYFQDIASTDKYLFMLTYNGVSFDEKGKDGAKIEVYDWNGNHLCRFAIPDAVAYLTVNEEGTILYAALVDGGMKAYSLPTYS